LVACYARIVRKRQIADLEGAEADVQANADAVGRAARAVLFRASLRSGRTTGLT
jgi:hypothetical protein